MRPLVWFVILLTCLYCWAVVYRISITTGKEIVYIESHYERQSINEMIAEAVSEETYKEKLKNVNSEYQSE